MVGRGLPVAVPLLLAGLALFFGGGPGDGSIFWLGAGRRRRESAGCFSRSASPGAGLRRCRSPRLRCGVRRPSAGRACLTAPGTTQTAPSCTRSSLRSGSGRPRARARSRTGSRSARRGHRLVAPRQGLPFLYDYGGPDVTRLRGPIGLWNQLALATDYALALALALRGRAGALLAYSALVALLLTYSRGGILTAALVASRGSASRTSGSRAPPRSSPPRCRRRSSAGSRSPCPG